MYEKLKAENLPVSIVSIDWERTKSLEESKKIVNTFFGKEKISVPTYLDVEGKTVKEYDIMSFPTTLVLDADGVIRYRNVGFHPMSEEIFEAQLRSLLPKG